MGTGSEGERRGRMREKGWEEGVRKHTRKTLILALLSFRYHSGQNYYKISSQKSYLEAINL